MTTPINNTSLSANAVVNQGVNDSIARAVQQGPATCAPTEASLKEAAPKVYEAMEFAIAKRMCDAQTRSNDRIKRILRENEQEPRR